MMKAFRFAVAALFFISMAKGAERPEYLDSFNAADGFKPAQRDLTAIYLQLAGSLEAFGSPEPYLRHVVKEHARIESLYRKKFGTDPKSFRPAYLTDAYVSKLAENWKFLSPDLGLDPFAKEFGHMMREAIKGTRGNGTMIIAIFNDHQGRVFDSISGKTKQPIGFEALRQQLVTKLELDQKEVNEGQYEVVRRDAVRSAIILHGMTMKLFGRLDAGLNPADSAKVKSILTSIILDTGVMAESELQAGISEWAFAKMSASN